MRTRRYAWDLDLAIQHGDDPDDQLLDGLPRPSRRRRITPFPASAPAPAPAPAASSSDDNESSCASSSCSSSTSGHTTDDSSSVASSAPPSSTSGSAGGCVSPILPPENGDGEEGEPLQREQQREQRRRTQRGKVALVLGMIRMTDEFMEKYIGPADPLLDLHSARDTRRIRFLERELRGERMEVISLADARQLPGVDHVQSGGRHVSCLFESPSLRDLQRALNGRTIGLIVGDYIRMPPHYLRTAYIPVVKVLLPALLRSGLLAPDCVHVYMPYPRRQVGVPNVYAAIEDAFMPNRPGAPRLVGPNECPLYRATKALFKEEHMHKTEGLTPGTPFLHFVLGESVETSRALRGPWW